MAPMPRRRHLFAPLLLLIAAACAREAASPNQSAAEQIREPRVTDIPARRGAALLRQVMLDRHNAARAAVAVPPLAWSDALAASAAAYAQVLGRSGRLAHAVQPQGPTRQGENLWMGSRGAYRYDEMAGHWIDERRDFVNATTPNFSRTGRWQDVGHYTQIVWRGSTAVGCAVASNRSDDFLVCRYAPAGNVVGSRAF
jgi:hypothetical protein